MNININNFQLTDIFNIHYKVFSPIKKFVSKKDFMSISKNMKTINGNFFPIPIYFNITNKENIKLKKNFFVNTFYNKNFVCKLYINNIYKFTHKQKLQIAKNIFLTDDLNHPGLKKFISEDNLYLEAEIKNFNENLYKKINFSIPQIFLKNLKRKKIKNLAGFHTRNVPHKAHEWIHLKGLEKCGALLIQPLIGQYRKGEYIEKVIINTNKYLVKSVYKKKNVFFKLFNSYPRYAGPKEALLHAIVRRNFGCSHFMVGRDHAGVGNYYGVYDSQKLCFKLQNKLKIEIIKFNEPYLCKNCKRIINTKCKKCKIIKKYKISGTFIRNKIANAKRINKLIMNEKISNMLSKRDLI